MEELKARSTPLELNPTSNVRTGVCPSFADHPLRRYFDAGLLVTLNSDDPAFFGSDVANEYLLAHTEQGFTREELRQLAANSIRASFLPDLEKAALALPDRLYGVNKAARVIAQCARQPKAKLGYHVGSRRLATMSAEPEPFTPAGRDQENTKRPAGDRLVLELGWPWRRWASIVGTEMRSRYKFKRRTPYDFYSNAGEHQISEFGMGI